jgi:hypothetical protein
MDKTKMHNVRIPKELAKDMKDVKDLLGTNWTFETVKLLQKRVCQLKNLSSTAPATSSRELNAQ